MDSGAATSDSGHGVSGIGVDVGGTGATGGFGCDDPFVVTCNSVDTWSSTAAPFGGGGLFSYDDFTHSLTGDTADGTAFHLTGVVGLYAGFGVYLNRCSTLAGYTSVTFSLSGVTASVDKPNRVHFEILDNRDELIDVENHKGMCVGSAGLDCVSPGKDIMLSDAPTTVLFSELTGGKPSGTLDPSEVLGFMWQFEPDASHTPFAVDVKLDHLTLIGGNDPGSALRPGVFPVGFA